MRLSALAAAAAAVLAFFHSLTQGLVVEFQELHDFRQKSRVNWMFLAKQITVIKS